MGSSDARYFLTVWFSDEWRHPPPFPQTLTLHHVFHHRAEKIAVSIVGTYRELEYSSGRKCANKLIVFTSGWLLPLYMLSEKNIIPIVKRSEFFRKATSCNSKLTGSHLDN